MNGYTELRGCPQPPPVAGRGRKPRALRFGPQLPKHMRRRKSGPLLPAGFRRKRGKNPALQDKVRTKKLRFSRRRGGGSGNFLKWILAKVRRAMTGGGGDYRNHGYTNSGQGGRTGRAGYKSRGIIF